MTIWAVGEQMQREEMQSDTFADAMETNVLSAERAAAGRFAWLNNQG